MDTTNRQCVGVRDTTIVVMAPKVRMTREEAMVHAAWLLVLAECAQPVISSEDVDAQFSEIVKQIRNT